MLRLMIMRHGEAASGIGFGDKERKLTEHGVLQAKETARRILEHAWIPELALVSTAVRTRETFDALQMEIDRDVPVRYVDLFYLGSFRDVVAEFDGVSDKTVLVIGHNPGWSEIAMRLTGKPITLSPAQACLISSGKEQWSEALHFEGDWRLDHWVQTR